MISETLIIPSVENIVLCVLCDNHVKVIKKSLTSKFYSFEKNRGHKSWYRMRVNYGLKSVSALLDAAGIHVLLAFVRLTIKLKRKCFAYSYYRIIYFSLNVWCISWKILSRKQCVDICTDGAWSKVGETCGFIAHVKACNALVANVSSSSDSYCKKDSRRTEVGFRRGWEDCKFYKNKTTDFKNFQCASWGKG